MFKIYKMECPICLKNLAVKIDPCQHPLCKKCFYKIHNTNCKCPLCRRDMHGLIMDHLTNLELIQVSTIARDGLGNKIKKFIPLIDLKSHIYSKGYKKYLSQVLFFEDNPYFTKYRVLCTKYYVQCGLEFGEEMCKIICYKPDDLEMYSHSDLLFMLKDNLLKLYETKKFKQCYFKNLGSIHAELIRRDNETNPCKMILNNYGFEEE